MEDYRYKVGVSFTGRHRDFVRDVCNALIELGFGKDKGDIFFDEWHQARITGPNADVLLSRIYAKECQAVVVFLSKDYKDKPWTGNIEWRAIRDLIHRSKAGKVCPFWVDKLDQGEYVSGYIDSIDGLSSTQDIASNVSEMSPSQVAEFIRDWYEEHVGGSVLKPEGSDRVLREEESRELLLGIGCDGSKLLLTDDALNALCAIEGELIENPSSRCHIANVTFEYEVQPIDLYHMLGGKDYAKNSELPGEIVVACEQWLARARTAYEDQARQAIAFALNDKSLESLFGRAYTFIDEQYRLSPTWRCRHHTNRFGLLSQYNMAFLWWKVIERVLLYMEGRYQQLWNAEHVTHIDCAYYGAKEDWYFSSVIGRDNEDLCDDKTLGYLCWPIPYPLDMYDVPVSDLVETVYPDLCWGVGGLIVNSPNKYTRLLEEYEGKCFDWTEMRIGLH